MTPEIIDLGYGGRRGIVGAWLAGDTLVDCGPMACLDALLAGLGDRRPRRLLLTHIHFDHAGAAGALVRRWPDLTVHVHPRGARHLADPSRLVASARMVYTEDFDRLVGEVVAVPAERLRVVDDGARLDGVRAAWTPGHASHHVAFLDEASGIAYPGDVAGVRLAAGVVIPPTPPPDIDLDLWRASLHVLDRWRPDALALPHFGLVTDPEPHLAELRAALDRHEAWALAADDDAFVAALLAHLRGRMPEPDADDYAFVALARPSAAGLRGWLERAAAA